jgi:hypothetical protein
MGTTRGYYIAKRLALALVLAFPVSMAVDYGLVAISHIWSVPVAPWLLYLPAIPMVLWWLSTVTYCFWWCPVCDKAIHTNWWGYSNPYSRSCVHCGERVGWFSPPSNT